MKTYLFNELSESAKITAIESFRDINVEYTPWMDDIINEAEKSGIIIERVYNDLTDISLDFDVTEMVSANELVLKYDESDERYRIAKRLLNRFSKIVDKWPLDYMNSFVDTDRLYRILDLLFLDFKNNLKMFYLSLFDKEYKRLTSDNEVIYTITESGFTFDKNGTPIP